MATLATIPKQTWIKCGYTCGHWRLERGHPVEDGTIDGWPIGQRYHHGCPDCVGVASPAIPKSRVRVDTWQFEAAHGRKPRGRGSWFFCDSADTVIFEAHGLYGACRVQAVAWAAANGYFTIAVAT